MTIDNNASVHYYGGFLPNIVLVILFIMLVLLYYYYYIPLENPIKCPEECLSLQPMFPPSKRFGIFPPVLGGGCSEGPDRYRYVFPLPLNL